MHYPQLMVKVAMCPISQIFVTVVLGPGRNFTTLLALYFTAGLVCSETGFASVSFSLSGHYTIVLEVLPCDTHVEQRLTK